MEKYIHDQTADRTIVYVPMPFTEEGLAYIVRHCNGFEDEPDSVDDYVDAILAAQTVDLNPSSELGEGCNIVDIFSFGLMAFAKMQGLPEPDIKQLWFHPCLNRMPVKIKSIEVEKQPCEIISHELVMYEALDGFSGQVVTADQVGAASAKCPGNSDKLEAYDKRSDEHQDDDGLPF